MRVIVSGGTGFIGWNLVHALLARGHEVLSIARKLDLQKQDRLEVLSVDLIDIRSKISALESFRPDVACHLAWEGIPDFSLERCQQNLLMGVHFIGTLMEIPSCQKVIGAGSCAEYGIENGCCLEAEPTSDVSDFSWAKNSIRRYGRMRAAKVGRKFGWFRIFYVYGPGQRAKSLVPGVIAACHRNEEFKLRDPKAAQDFVYIDDVVDAFARAVEVDWPSGDFNLGSGTLTTVQDVVLMVKSILRDSALPPVASPVEGGFWASTERSRQFLGWQATTKIEDGLTRTIQQVLAV